MIESDATAGQLGSGFKTGTNHSLTNLYKTCEPVMTQSPKATEFKDNTIGGSTAIRDAMDTYEKLLAKETDESDDKLTIAMHLMRADLHSRCEFLQQQILEGALKTRKLERELHKQQRETAVLTQAMSRLIKKEHKLTIRSVCTRLESMAIAQALCSSLEDVNTRKLYNLRQLEKRVAKQKAAADADLTSAVLTSARQEYNDTVKGLQLTIEMLVGECSGEPTHDDPDEYYSAEELTAIFEDRAAKEKGAQSRDKVMQVLQVYRAMQAAGAR